MCGIAGMFAFSPSAPPVARAELRAMRDHMAARGPDGQGECFFRQRSRMRHQLLMDSNWTSMAHSQELRVPSLDVPVLRVTAPWLVAHAGLTKLRIADALAPRLPANLLNKPKTKLSIPVVDWLMSDQGEVEGRGYRGRARHVHIRYITYQSCSTTTDQYEVSAKVMA